MTDFIEQKKEISIDEMREETQRILSNAKACAIISVAKGKDGENGDTIFINKSDTELIIGLLMVAIDSFADRMSNSEEDQLKFNIFKHSLGVAYSLLKPEEVTFQTAVLRANEVYLKLLNKIEEEAWSRLST